MASQASYAHSPTGLVTRQVAVLLSHPIVYETEFNSKLEWRSFMLCLPLQSSVVDIVPDPYLSHTLDTVAGQSGSPLWTLISGSRRVRQTSASWWLQGTPTAQEPS